MCEATPAPCLLCCWRRRLPFPQGTDTPISMRPPPPSTSARERRLERPAVMNRTPMSTDRLNSVANTTARAIIRSSLALPLLLSDDARLSLLLPPFFTLDNDEVVVNGTSFLPRCLERETQRNGNRNREKYKTINTFRSIIQQRFDRSVKGRAGGRTDGRTDRRALSMPTATARAPERNVRVPLTKLVATNQRFPCLGGRGKTLAGRQTTVVVCRGKITRVPRKPADVIKKQARVGVK